MHVKHTSIELKKKTNKFQTCPKEKAQQYKDKEKQDNQKSKFQDLACLGESTQRVIIAITIID